MTATMTLQPEQVNQASFVTWSPDEALVMRMPANLILVSQDENLLLGEASRVEFQPIRLGIFWLAGGELIRPLPALIERGQGSFVATEPTTGLFGVGLTFAAAVCDLRLALREHLEVLGSEGPLAEGLELQLAFLRSHLRS